MCKELPEAISSIFQIEQEDIEWGALEVESTVFKPQETLQVQSAEELSKPLEHGQPTSDSKEAKPMSLKEIVVSKQKCFIGQFLHQHVISLCYYNLAANAKSSEFLQIKGKQIKRMQKRESLRPRKSSKPLYDCLCTLRIPRDYFTPHLHNLCTTIPARQLPIDLCLASRVYHTANRKGHNTLLGIFGTSFLDDRFTDEEQRER
ncbi:hypothetical protein P7K49_017978 [Saguinus oedipus]|uniref:Uncharacterized protein n=1 Tax=Saguinus oedipus TaxID=9490 RepID=A0ABQ9V6S6_SAGOE|nr:hypothetical protein P7K49_017978 [Saguinus oedipus]